jgi:hypothetical protein
VAARIAGAGAVSAVNAEILLVGNGPNLAQAAGGPRNAADSSSKGSPMKLDFLRCSGVAVAAALTVCTLPSIAHADEVVVVEHEEYRGPRWGMVSSGLFVFAGTYTASFVVASTSDHAGDKALYAPLVGPWLDMANRCPNGCTNDLGNKVLLGFDGVFQSIGALSVLSGLLLPRRGHGHVAANEKLSPTFQIVPASYGRGTPGLAAVGTF